MMRVAGEIVSWFLCSNYSKIADDGLVDDECWQFRKNFVISRNFESRAVREKREKRDLRLVEK